MPTKQDTPQSIIPAVYCQECGAEIPIEKVKQSKNGRKFCDRSCQGKHKIRTLYAWEKAISEELAKQGWTTFLPSACCDRIGIKDGRAYFLEFKPEGHTKLRVYQQALHDAVPSMYRTVVGTNNGVLDPRIVRIYGGGVYPEGEVRSLLHSPKSPTAKTTSRFKGVCLRKSSGRWRSSIMIRGKRYALGIFATEEEAAHAYDKAALRVLGYRVNFPV